MPFGALLFGLSVILDLQVVANTFMRFQYVKKVENNFDVMILGQVEREETGPIGLGAKRIRIVGRVDEAAEHVVDDRLAVTHVVGRLTVVVDLCVVAVARALRLQAEPAVLHHTLGLVHAFAE